MKAVKRYQYGFVVTLILALSIVMLSAAGTKQVYAFDGEGAGTSEEPYEIATCEELQSISSDADLAASYVLTHDVNCSDTINWNEGAGFDPIANTSNLFDKAFFGTFDGQGYAINDLYINRPTDPAVGLFASTVLSKIHDLIINGQIVGGNFTGGVVGFAYAGTDISDVTVNALTAGTSSDELEIGLPLAGVGGIAGITVGIPEVDDATISRSVSNGVVAAALPEEEEFNAGGGIVGTLMDDSALTDSYSTAIVGTEDPGQIALGGAVGMTFLMGDDIAPTISNSYSTGSVNIQTGNVGGGFLGGSAGGATLTNNFTAGPVLLDGEPSFSSDIGGFMGFSSDNDVLTNNYIDVTRSLAFTCVAGGFGDSEGCTGVNYGEIEDPDYFFDNHTNSPLNAWDFDCVWSTRIGDYPVLDVRACDSEPPDDSDDEGDGEIISSHKPISKAKVDEAISNLFAVETEPEQTEIDLDALINYTEGTGQELTDLRVGQVINFDITKDGETEHHTITIKSIGYNTVTITVASKPFDVVLELDKKRTISIEDQKIMDITLTDLSETGATLFIKRLPTTNGNESKTNAAQNNAERKIQVGLSDKNSSYTWIFAAAGLIMVLITVTFAVHRSYRRN